MLNNFEKIYEIVKKIPKGKVLTYGEIAKILGNVHLSRIVGYALHNNPNPRDIPCYRVVNRTGEVSNGFAFGGRTEQIRLLKNDGIEFISDGKLDLNKYLWKLN